MQRINTSWSKNNLSFSDKNKNVPVDNPNNSLLLGDASKIQISKEGHGSIGKIAEGNALSQLLAQ